MIIDYVEKIGGIMQPKYFFKNQNVTINIYSTASEDSVWKMLEEKIRQAKESMDIELPEARSFNLVVN